MDSEASADDTAVGLATMQSTTGAEQLVGETPSNRIEEVQQQFASSLFPTHHVENSGTAMLDRYHNPSTDPRTNIFIADNESVVGVSAGDSYIISITEQTGGFAGPESIADVTATIHQLGLDPIAVAHAVEHATNLGLEINEHIANHPAVTQILSLDPSDPFVNQPPPPQQSTVIDLQDVSPEINSVVGYNKDLETFQTTMFPDDGEQITFGTRRGEHLTPESLVAAIAEAGYNPPSSDAMRGLAQDVHDNLGDFTIVGLTQGDDVRLFAVSPGHHVSELRPTGEYSPEGFNFGYDGSGPAEAAKAIIAATHGAEVANDVATVRAFTSNVISNLPDTFSLSGTAISKTVSDGPQAGLTEPIGFNAQGPAIDAVSQHINSPAHEVGRSIEAPGPQLSM